MRAQTRRTIGTWAFSFVLGPLLCAAAFGCKSKSEKAASAAPSASGAEARLPPPKPRKWPAPSGPVLAILAGQGVGPIRIGANVATIERLMEAPCEFKTANVCRYMGRGVEFVLENGATKTVHVYRAGRPAGKDKAGEDAEYGFFRGAIPPDVQLGMIPVAIEEAIGKPPRVDRRELSGTEKGEIQRAETHYYPGLTIFYDRLENGNLVMAEVIIEKKSATDAGAPSASPAPSPAPSVKR